MIIYFLSIHNTFRNMTSFQLEKLPPDVGAEPKHSKIAATDIKVANVTLVLLNR